MKSRPNPYARELKREITIDTDISVIEYFPSLVPQLQLWNEENPKHRAFETTE
jgi:hypothetical protein